MNVKWFEYLNQEFMQINLDINKVYFRWQLHIDTKFIIHLDMINYKNILFDCLYTEFMVGSRWKYMHRPETAARRCRGYNCGLGARAPPRWSVEEIMDWDVGRNGEGGVWQDSWDYTRAEEAAQNVSDRQEVDVFNLTVILWYDICIIFKVWWIDYI